MSHRVQQIPGREDLPGPCWTSGLQGCLRKAIDCGVRSGFTSQMGHFPALVPSEIHHLLAAPPHPIRALSSQGSLTSQPLPSHPLLLAATSFSPFHPHYLVQAPHLLHICAKDPDPVLILSLPPVIHSLSCSQASWRRPVCLCPSPVLRIRSRSSPGLP